MTQQLALDFSDEWPWPEQPGKLGCAVQSKLRYKWTRDALRAARADVSALDALSSLVHAERMRESARAWRLASLTAADDS